MHSLRIAKVLVEIARLSIYYYPYLQLFSIIAKCIIDSCEHISIFFSSTPIYFFDTAKSIIFLLLIFSKLKVQRCTRLTNVISSACPITRIKLRLMRKMKMFRKSYKSLQLTTLYYTKQNAICPARHTKNSI